MTTQAEIDATLGQQQTVRMEDIVRKREKIIMAEEELSRSPYFKPNILWSNVIYIAILHGLAIRALFYLPTGKYQTLIYAYTVATIAGFGLTAGVHRYFSHRSFKAKIPLQILLIACYTVAGQNPIPDWVRDHRMHHKFCDTNADPHNVNRGFFFAHVGWLMQRKHPEIYKRGKTIDMSDITGDPLIRFHTNRIQPTQNLICSILTLGEGWHNYHHVFPRDYRPGEYGGYLLNSTTMWLDFFARLGWAYDLKTTPKHLVQKMTVNHGDGSWQRPNNNAVTVLESDTGCRENDKD